MCAYCVCMFDGAGEDGDLVCVGLCVNRHPSSIPNGPQAGPTGAQLDPNLAQTWPNRGPHGMLLGQ